VVVQTAAHIKCGVTGRLMSRLDACKVLYLVVAFSWGWTGASCGRASARGWKQSRIGRPLQNMVFRRGADSGGGVASAGGRGSFVEGGMTLMRHVNE
jgi:hypothetical protein